MKLKFYLSSLLRCMAVLSMCVALVACGTHPSRYSSSSKSTTVPGGAIPKNEPYSKAGNKSTYRVFGKQYQVRKTHHGYKERGMASWYGKQFHGRLTSNLERYDMYAMTAAHKSLPIPSYVKVTNLRNKKSIVVRVNDRGPFHSNRIIDLSYAAAKKLGMAEQGTAMVELEAISVGKSSSQKAVKVAQKPTAKKKTTKKT